MSTRTSDTAQPAAPPDPRKIDKDSIQITFETVRSPSDYIERQVQAWPYSVSASSPDVDDILHDDTRVLVGRGLALIVELHNGRDPLDAMDEHSANALKIAEVIFDDSGEDLDQEVRRSARTPRRSRVGPRYGRDRAAVSWTRARPGLGPLIAGLAIVTLSGGAVAVVCYPAPLHHPLGLDGQPRDFQDDEWEAGVAKLSKLWATLGFEHFRDGVHYINMSHPIFFEKFEKILKAL